MITLPGQQKYMPLFAAEVDAGGQNAPEGGGATVQQWITHLRGVRQVDFADELQVLELATRLRLRIVVVAADIPLPCDHNPAMVGPDRTIYLGHANQHYVWLRPLPAAPHAGAAAAAAAANRPVPHAAGNTDVPAPAPQGQPAEPPQEDPGDPMDVDVEM